MATAVVSTPIPPAAAKKERSADSLKWLILLTVIIGTFLGRLDQTIVNLALPKIINDFGINVSAAGWVGTAYILANAVFVPIWGKLGDTIGRKKVYVIGFVGFIIGSILAGFAWNLPSLIVFRVIQAIAGSADYPTAMAILSVTFPDQKSRGQALGIWSSVFGASAVLGPLIGGPLIDTFGWRSVFLVNLPVGVIGLFMALTFITESKLPEKFRKFDWWGAITLGITLGALVLVLDKGSDWGWMSVASILSYLIILATGALFFFIEKNHSEPIVDLKFFSNPVFVNTLANNFVVFMAMMGSIFLVPIFAQSFLGYTATESGYLFIPMAIGLMGAAPFGAALVGRVKPGIVIGASTLMAGFGIALFGFIDARSTPIDLMIPLFIMAVGMGFGMAQRTSAIAGAVPPSEIGVASGILALARNIAGAFGIAIFGTLLNWAIERNILSINSMSEVYVKTPQIMAQYTGLIILKAQIDAYALIYELAAGLLVIGAISSFFIKVPEREMTQEQKAMAEI
ncbi:MAG: transporter, family, tetracycline resistance protein [Parcubacteria group bacterium]|nr:transporter, family, tetracycline resistance protein [Parcubacteria group bacterium]